MTRDPTEDIPELIARLARIGAADDWTGELNPTQLAALRYLARANTFSRAPSLVADYLAATRGTVSQTLKSLARKGLVRELRSTLDRRSISYSLTPAGEAALDARPAVPASVAALDGHEAAALAAGLRRMLGAELAARGGRSFGLCRTCRHHGQRGGGAYCELLETPLGPGEADRICHEHSAPTAEGA